MSATIHTPRLAAEHRSADRSFVRRLLVLVRGFGLARETRAQRRALLALDPHLLADLGLSREQALTEASRPLWDVPATWRR